ncbi:hypothetical protein FHS72_002899 [Loktanella ponticola]|uniref:Uncharacterized protein n=1 Tax=Yoonia ponticola TaxID=1524255 RepID=A0A7W9BMI2_9RHOB|nr:hypothetical protein [Yoonia ponticola]
MRRAKLMVSRRAIVANIGASGKLLILDVVKARKRSNDTVVTTIAGNWTRRRFYCGVTVLVK